MIEITDNATDKLKEIMMEEYQNPNLEHYLRVFVQGGGCSGFQYGFTLEDIKNEDDFDFEKNGVKIVIDVMSLQYLNGATIDYKDDLSGSQFIIKNPNASSTCGCGASFTIDN